MCLLLLFQLQTSTPVPNQPSTMTCEGDTDITFDLRNASESEIRAWMVNTESIISDIYIGTPMMMFGSLANLSFLFVLLRVPSMRTITNCYLGNLAFADFCFVTIAGLNLGLHRIHFDFVVGNWYYSAWICMVVHSSLYWPRYASLMLVTLVVFERYMGICHPLKSRMISTWGRTIKLIAGAWLVCLIPVACQLLTGNSIIVYCFLWPDEYSHLTPSTRFCVPNYANPKIVTSVYYLIFLIEIVPFLTALLINSSFYYMIIAALGKRASNGPLRKKSKNSQVDEVKRQVAKMLIINGIAFFITGLPWALVHLLYLLKDTGVDMPWVTRPLEIILSKVALISVILNSSINPIIYGITNPRYRQAFKTAFTFGFMKKVDGNKNFTKTVSQSQFSKNTTNNTTI